MNNPSKVIILGSGPISLLKCWILLKDVSISKITIIDSKSKIGGAWYYEENKGSKLETGCHIWSYCPKVYGFIAKELEIKLKPFYSKPIFKKNKLIIPYAFKNTIDSYFFLIKGILKLDFKILGKIKNSPRYYLNVFGKKNLYPINGSPELITILHNKILSDKRVEFILNSEINTININENVHVSSNTYELIADKIYITSTIKLNQLLVSNTQLNYKTTNTNYIHYKFKLNKKPLKTASYYRVADNKIIHRIADISYQNQNNQYVILVAVFDNSHSSIIKNEIILRIKEYFIQQKIITTDTVFELVKIYEFPTYYSDQKTRNEINKLEKSKLELLHSTDLMYGMFELLKNENLI